MSFQKCPICDGTGIDPSNFFSNNACPTCVVCHGKRIISEITGLPPGPDVYIASPIYSPPKDATDYLSTQNPTQDVSNIQSRES